MTVSRDADWTFVTLAYMRRIYRTTTLCRHFKTQAPNAPTIRKSSPRRLSAGERQAVLEVLHEPRFAD